MVPLLCTHNRCLVRWDVLWGAMQGTAPTTMQGSAPTAPQRGSACRTW